MTPRLAKEIAAAISVSAAAVLAQHGIRVLDGTPTSDLVRELGNNAAQNVVAILEEIEETTTNDDSTSACINSVCKHPRSMHCKCGASCLGYSDGDTANCECGGFERPPQVSLNH